LAIQAYQVECIAIAHFHRFSLNAVIAASHFQVQNAIFLNSFEKLCKSTLHLMILATFMLLIIVFLMLNVFIIAYTQGLNLYGLKRHTAQSDHYIFVLYSPVLS